MISYNEAKSRAMHDCPDWNERMEITCAKIAWYDSQYEYNLDIPNESHMEDEEFQEYVIKNANDLVAEDANAKNLVPEGIDRIDFVQDYIDDDALFDQAYEAACEEEWESRTGR